MIPPSTPVKLIEARVRIGYIGGSFLARLLSQPNASIYDITVLVRSPEKAQKLKAIGVTPVLGSLNDLELLEDLASKAHIVFSCVRIAFYTALSSKVDF